MNSTQPKSWKHNNVLMEIHAIKERLHPNCVLEVIYESRTANFMADFFAKGGINRLELWVAWLG